MTDVLEELVERYPELAGCAADVRRAFELIAEAYRGGGKLLVCGNGGSAADSEHIVGELMKGFKSPRRLPPELGSALAAQFGADGEYLADRLQGALPTISLASQTALLTALANDIGADVVFAQQVYGYGRAGDALLGISTSGGSTNVLHALRAARALGMRTIGLTGRTGGRMAELCDVTIRVPYDETMRIQERQFPVYHALCLMLEREFFPES